MNGDDWLWFWAGAAALLLVAEIFTAGFFLFPFGIGAGAAACAAALGLPEWIQWGVFLIVSLPTLLAARAYARRSNAGAAPVEAGDRLTGKVGIVVKKIEVSGLAGLVRVAGEEWSAKPEQNHDIAVGDRVEVVRVSGAHLIVKLHLSAPAETAA